MKRVFIYLSVAIAICSCKKDAEHQLMNDYSLPSTKPVFNIDNSGVTIAGTIKQFGKEPIIDHGFVWSTKEEPTLNDSHISLGILESKNDFSIRITHDLKPGQTYYVRAYIATDNYVVYGEQQIFKSLGSSAPIIERIEPAEITYYMKRIIVYGKNFCSNKSDAKINSWNYYIDSISPDSIVIYCQSLSRGTNTLELSIFDKKVPVTFEAVGLIFENATPTRAEIQSVVSIKGRHLNNIKEIRFTDSHIVDIVEKSEKEVKIKIPVLKDGPATLRIMDIKHSSYYDTEHVFELPFEIISPWKKVDLPFELPQVSFCNYQDILYTFNIPNIYRLDLQSKTYQSIATIPQNLPWPDYTLYFMIGSKFCICTRGDLFLCYDVATGSWENLPSYTKHYNSPILGFSIENKGYVYGKNSGYGDYFLYEFDPSTKLWRLIDNINHISNWPDGNVSAAVCNGKAYVSAGNKIWEFDNQTYSFEEKVSSAIDGWYSFTYNDKVYSAGSRLIEYDPATNQIEQLPQQIYSYMRTMFFWKNFLFAYVYTDKEYEYLAIDLDKQ